MSVLERQRRLKNALSTGRPVLGMFVKTPSMHIVEILGSIGLDCIVLDAEHAPFSVDSLDSCILAARAAGLPVLVRVADCGAAAIAAVLDMGAAGVLIPHLRSAAEATAVIAATRYVNGVRGFSTSHRAGGYGTLQNPGYIESSDASVVVIGQIEDVNGVDNVDEIAAVPALDALFIGPADLSVSCGVNGSDEPVVKSAIERICSSGMISGKPVGIFQPTADQVRRYRDKGINLFLISTDQALLLKAAQSMVESFRAACR